MKKHTRSDDSGFMMVALLVCMSIAAIWMAASLTNMRHQAQREKEDDLVFRGEQYARAIALYQNKNRGLPPPDIDTLITQHYLRKKWKDPITGTDFALVGIGIITQTTPAPGQSAFGQTTQPQPASQINATSQQPGITGVRSTSTLTSIKVYTNQQQYNLWQFDAQTYRNSHGMGPVPQQGGGQNGGRQGGGRDTGPGGARGGPGGARGGPGGPGAPGGQPGGPGRVGPGGGAPPPPGGAGRGRGGD
jgi:type II secretory pathway pseudopilin PulG